MSTVTQSSKAGMPAFRYLETLQDNHRYKVSLIEQDGEERILKQCTDPTLTDMLAHDIQSSFYLEMVREYNTESVFRVRRIYSYGHDWYIAEKLSGEPLFEKETKRDLQEELRLARELYAPFIYETSVYTPQVLLGKYPFIDVHYQPNDKFHEALKKVDEWSQTAIEGKFLQPDEAARIRTFIEQHLGEVKYGVELYDLDTTELFVLPEGKLGVIDLEYLNLRGRRHFDAVYDYLRLWLDIKRPPLATAMLERYVQICGEENMDGAFLSLFGIKLLGYLMDAARWMKDTKEKGKPVVYSYDETRPLLDRYLEFKIDALLS